jgi:GINS complex subunit 1
MVRLVLLETRQLQSHIASLLSTSITDAESDPGLAAQLVTHHLCAQRNKRCLLAYHHSRLYFLRQALWNNAGSLTLTLNQVMETGHSKMTRNSEVEQKTTLKSRLSSNEMDYLKNYSQLTLEYKSEFLDIVDIASSLRRSGQRDDVGPIKELMVTVVANVDAKDVQTERGSINLRRGERMRVLRSEVDALITRDWVTVVEE